ncbi:hypothetical protein L211DRAFT_450441 [Terfezia boudieri ATCC MYA-4762]|uniref:MULE transposase domain-containing protein n=1 Tax=Terfezia boudieri ATCC MYA-4762 TaxID=1051890 RepID=A0A3N4LE56_9PEZI|nr:hypothetical protein L211DRAFT_450441 [Terfezia boudieri ATCC MYA-4762]
MTDDSAIEQRAIRLAFPGLNGGEQEVAHLLCSVHSNRTLLRRLGSNANKPIYQLLKHAMYFVTQIQNRALCEQAVAAATAIDNTGNMANYVQTYWLQTASKWAMYARQHSPFLLQATTTNACEAWHRKLKSGAGLSKGQVASHGIYGMILNIMDAAKDVDNRAVVAKSRFRNRKLAVCTKQYKEIGHRFLSRNCLLVNLMLLRNALQRERRCLILMRIYGAVASSTGNTYFHVGTSSTSILKPKY